jgi:hypothetical protein
MQLVIFVRQGISGGHQDANYRPPWPPDELLLFARNAVKKQGEYGVFSKMG